MTLQVFSADARPRLRIVWNCNCHVLPGQGDGYNCFLSITDSGSLAMSWSTSLCRLGHLNFNNLTARLLNFSPYNRTSIRYPSCESHKYLHIVSICLKNDTRPDRHERQRGFSNPVIFLPTGTGSKVWLMCKLSGHWTDNVPSNRHFSDNVFLHPDFFVHRWWSEFPKDRSGHRLRFFTGNLIDFTCSPKDEGITHLSVQKTHGSMYMTRHSPICINH